MAAGQFVVFYPVAMAKELALLHALKGPHSHLQLTGIGKVNAALATQQAIWRWRPSLVVSIGTSGGIGPGLTPGDLVAGARYTYHDVWCGEGNLPGQIQELPQYYPGDSASIDILRHQTLQRVQLGDFACGEHFIPSPEKIAAIHRDFPQAIAVDMESTAVAQTCHLAGIPFIGLRVISDTPGSRHNHSAQYQQFWQQEAAAAFNRLTNLANYLCTQRAAYRP